MDINNLATMLDSGNCAKLSMDEKSKLVYELAKHPHGNPEMLLSWSRHEILQLLCAEMGKERKYTGLTKLKIIENLLKIVSEKISAEFRPRVVAEPIPDPSVNFIPKIETQPDHLFSSAAPANSSTGSNAIQVFINCKNSACRASLSPEDKFCKRCSCCICQKFDDNKDPSLWLTCSSEPPFEGESCNMSCHLDCALKHERSGLSKMGQVAQLDGSFYCVSCGKMNDLLKCWRKQLTIARDTRRADILCYRVSLSQKLVSGTNKYEKLSDIVDEAVNKLQAEVGPLNDITANMGRGIVNRMSSGHQVQRLCASAVELLDAVQMLARPADQGSTIRFEDVCATSVTVILGPDKPASDPNVRFTMWNYKVADEKEPHEPTCTLSPPGTRIIVGGLTPSTEYVFKVVCFDNSQVPDIYEARLSTAAPNTEIIPGATLESSQSPVVTNCSALSNPSSVEDETNNITSDLNDNNKAEAYYSSVPVDTKNGLGIRIGGAGQNENPVHASKGKNINDASLDQSRTVKLENKPVATMREIIPCPPPVTGLPITPSRKDILEKRPKTGNGDDQPQPRSSSKKRKRDGQDGGTTLGSEELFYLKQIRDLEYKGHMEHSFRQKFMTWYSLRASPHEVHVVRVFVKTFRDDPAALAEQLIHTFKENVLSSRSEAPTKAGFCMKIWH